MAASASVNHSWASGSVSAGRVRVRAQLRQSVPAAAAGTTQLHWATAAFAHAAQPPGSYDPGTATATIENESGSNPSTVPHVRHRSFSKKTRA